MKFSKVIGYQEHDLSMNRRVHASCLKLDNVIGQLTCHTCVYGQYLPHVHAVVVHFAKLIFFSNENV